MPRRIVQAAKTPIGSVIGATIISGGGGMALFDAVMGHLVDEQAAHIETLERALELCAESRDRFDRRLEACHDRERDDAERARRREVNP